MLRRQVKNWRTRKETCSWNKGKRKKHKSIRKRKKPDGGKTKTNGDDSKRVWKWKVNNEIEVFTKYIIFVRIKRPAKWSWSAQNGISKWATQNTWRFAFIKKTRG